MICFAFYMQQGSDPQYQENRFRMMVVLNDFETQVWKSRNLSKSALEAIVVPDMGRSPNSMDSRSTFSNLIPKLCKLRKWMIFHITNHMKRAFLAKCPLHLITPTKNDVCKFFWPKPIETSVVCTKNGATVYGHLRHKQQKLNLSTTLLGCKSFSSVWFVPIPFRESSVWISRLLMYIYFWRKSCFSCLPSFRIWLKASIMWNVSGTQM